MTARDDVRDEFSWTPFAAQEAEYERLLDAFRVEVLREAAEAVMVRAEETQDMKARIGLGVAHYVLTEMADAAAPTSKEQRDGA